MKDIRNNLILGGLFGIGVLIALVFLSDPGLENLGTYIREFPPHFVVIILLFTLLNYAVRWIKWDYYLRIVGLQNFPKLDSVALWVAGFVLALTPGKVGELLKAVALHSMAGLPVARGAPIIIAERVTDGLAMLLLAAIGFGGILYTSPGLESVVSQYIPAYLAVMGLLIAGIIAIQVRPLFAWSLQVFERLPVIGHLGKSFHLLYESSLELFSPLPVLISVLLGLASWIWECIGFFLILWGLGIEPSWLLLWQAMFILAASTIIGAVSGLPGGLGAAELSIVGMVQLIVLESMNSSLAGAASLFVRISTLWFAVLLGLITAVIFRQRLFNRGLGKDWAAAQSEIAVTE